MKVIRRSENREQMQLHKKHDETVPAHLLWNARAGAPLSSRWEHLPRTSALLATVSWHGLPSIEGKADSPKREERDASVDCRRIDEDRADTVPAPLQPDAEEQEREIKRRRPTNKTEFQPGESQWLVEEDNTETGSRATCCRGDREGEHEGLLSAPAANPFGPSFILGCASEFARPHFLHPERVCYNSMQQSVDERFIDFCEVTQPLRC
ncbi:hypothetical protein HJG60_012111 [Phyllostomus discolor]|uniref:Uncharacterized protein n=1 Tax=Phyllostomus discolor TaxID=89673 RepID=A0A833ZM84_9CHIR|nr:hypothetical protein HJG60_012111 [Phyllostomus discolor]